MEHVDLDTLVDRFGIFDDWEERYSYVIELGRDLLPLEDSEKTEENRVRGCVSQVWLVHEERGGKHYFRADSDAHIVRGLIKIVLSAYDGKTTDEIREVDIEGAFSEMGLDTHLSQNRRNGFFSMVQRIKAHAAAA